MKGDRGIKDFGKGIKIFLLSLYFMLPGCSPCRVGLGVTSSRSSVNRGEHVDEVLHRQQGRAAPQRHVLIQLFEFDDVVFLFHRATQVKRAYVSHLSGT
ncbi:hypothetical protein EYF80_043775 [Liparis tanakae]|uniref:Secreted protein n=1 Tax=Liparis tanakae TaxID=230148 RepID=A0A4Z2FXS4_9TELE|nr:hypothetical protein EYF80_043775 [Liparis tanakae]